MAPFDVPHISHDMILRFMGVNFSAIFEGSARIPSSIGAATKPHFLEEVPTAAATVAPETGKSPQQAKAMWEGTPPFNLILTSADNIHLHARSVLQRRLRRARPDPDIRHNRDLCVVSPAQAAQSAAASEPARGGHPAQPCAAR
jgi:carboxypeptidase D